MLRMSTTSNPGSRRLVIWPQGSDLTPIKEAVMALGLPYKVAPFWLDLQSSHDDRVLVLADNFDAPLVCDSIYPKNPERLKDAILWCLGEKELERGPRLYIDKMREIFGEGVVEIWEPEKGETEKADAWP